MDTRRVTPVEPPENDQAIEKNASIIDLKNDEAIPPSDNKLISLSWENINVYTPGSTGGIFGKLGCIKPVESKHIIKDVNGVAKPGSLMAIMGASGAGKTTLLNILNFRNRGSLKVTGEVKINGATVTSRDALTSISGYVQQEDLFIGTLKVGELLKFQAMLRMDRKCTNEQRIERVEQIMNDLNLKKCENTLIGSPEKGIKGISGGEKRRLAFGCELITDPNLMFFDEPTSGLDAYMANSIVECMRLLARRGKTIVCTIHQPSSEVFDKFDRLVLMAEGRLAYIGSLKETEKFFTSLGFPVPVNFNPADFYIQTLAMVPNNREECLETINKVCESFKDSVYGGFLKQDLKESNSMATNPNIAIKLNNKIEYKSNFMRQLKWLIWRSYLSTLRDPFATKIAIIQTLMIAVLIGLIFLQLKYDQAGVQNMNGVMFILLTNNSFTNLFAVINTFPAEIPIFLRDHQNGMYSVISYYLSKILSDLPKFIILPLIFVAINYWMSNLNPDVGRFFICCAIIILVANAAVSFGSFLSAVAPSANAAIGLSAPLLVPLMIFSGFFLNNSSVPSYFIWLKYLSWFNYANELLTVNQWDGITSISCPEGSLRCYRNGDDVINYLNMSKANYGSNFGAIVAILVGWRVLAFFALLLKSYRK